MEGFVLSEALHLGIVTESKNLLLRHLILLARHHICVCKLKETRPSFEMYKQFVRNTLHIGNKIAIVNEERGWHSRLVRGLRARGPEFESRISHPCFDFFPFCVA